MNDVRTMYMKLGRCEPGMRLAEDVHNELGAVVIQRFAPSRIYMLL